MRNPSRKIAFVLASSDHGPMIVNRFDFHMTAPQQGYGVGLQILETSAFDADEVDLALQLLAFRRRYFGDGVAAIDCGANIGVHTVEWSKRMTGWGTVLAFEPQERIYYALAGNVAVNNCFNARVVHAAVGAECGEMRIPVPDYLRPGSFGSLEIRPRQIPEYIGQQIDYANGQTAAVQCLTLDSLALTRIDLIKIDVEGMEFDVLEGSRQAITSSHPVMLIEAVKSDRSRLQSWLAERDYALFNAGLNILAIHQDDPCLPHVASPKIEP